MAIWCGFILIISLIGIGLPEDEPDIKPWLPKLDPRSSGPTVKKRKAKTTWETATDYDWQDDKDNETIEWHEFLEELDNRGLTPYDQEAQEIWDNNYR